MAKNFSKTKVLYALISLAIIAVVVILLSPILLIFTEGRDGSVTPWNFVGIAYLLLVFWVSTKVNKHYKNSNNG